MLPSVNDVLKANGNPIVTGAIYRISNALVGIVIPDDDIPSFSLIVELGAERPLSYGERLRIKVALNEKGWDATFKLDTLQNEVAVVFIKQ